MRHFATFLVLLTAIHTLRSELYLPSAFPTTAILSPDCKIVRVKRTKDAMTVAFIGKLTSSDSTLRKLYGTQNEHVIHLHNTSEDEAGPFSVFCDSIELLKGKKSSIDIVTSNYRYSGSGIYLDFATSRCRIHEHTQKE